MPRGELGGAKREEAIRLRAQGHKCAEIGEKIGANAEVVRRTLASQEARAAIAEVHREAMGAIQDSFVAAQLLAWRTMVAALRDGDPRIRIMAAKDILDRGPMVRGASVDITGASVESELAALSVAQLRALAGEEDVTILEVTPEAK